MILNEFKEILKNVQDSRVGESLDYVEKCLNLNTPSHEISIIELVAETYRLIRSIEEKNKDKFESLVEKVENILIERGYRTDTNTYQEHQLMGSTVWKGYAEEPHKPIGVIKGDLTLEEAVKARELERMQGALGHYFCRDGFVTISLETLNEQGNTIRDPQLLDINLNPIQTSYSSDFPFRRAEKI